MPTISIGIPAYNSQNHIGFTIESLLAQSYGDFEIIVSDNASTDRTRDIVENYSRNDKRIRYVRQDRNIGANPNYSYVATIAKGKYFKWSSSSDWYAPTFLEKCRAVLESQADTVLVATRTRFFQTDLNDYVDYQHDIDLLDERPTDRFIRLTKTMALNNAMNGLIRTAALRATPLIEPYRNADIVLMGYLALLGKFRLLDDRLFYRRMDAQTATSLQSEEEVWKHHYPVLDARSLFQGSKRQIGWLRAALATPLGLVERVRALTYVAKIWYWERSVFVTDLSDASRYLIGKRQ